MHASRVLIPIMGFTERGVSSTGIEAIWREARKDASASDWILPPLRWQSDWRSIAALIDRNAQEDARIVIVAHSWGVGWGARKLSEKLAKIGRQVAVLVSADGVYRDPIIPPILPLNPLSILRYLRPRIPLPGNVRYVLAYKQRVCIPRGHEFRVGIGTHIDYRDVAVPHTLVDDMGDFQLEALAIWRRQAENDD